MFVSSHPSSHLCAYFSIAVITSIFASLCQHAGLKSDIRIYDTRRKSGKTVKQTEVQMDRKRAFVALCEAASDVCPVMLVKKPLLWAEFVPRVHMIMEERKELPDSSCRLGTGQHAEELLQEAICIAVAGGRFADAVRGWWRVARMWFTEEDVIRSEDGKLSLKPWSTDEAFLGRVPAADLTDAKEVITVFETCTFNDATYKMVKLVDKGEPEKMLIFLRTVLSDFDFSEKKDRQKWAKASVPSVPTGLEGDMNILRGILRTLSPIPGEHGSQPEHLELVWKMKPSKAASEKEDDMPDLGSINEAGKMLQSFMMKSEAWKKFRMGAEASKNIEVVLAPDHEKCLATAQNLAGNDLRFPQRDVVFTEIFAELKRFNESGMRADCNESILKQLLEVCKEDLKVASELPDEAADRIEIMKQIKERLARLHSKDIDTSDLCHLAMTTLTTWHSLQSTSGLQSVLTNNITSQIHVKELHQYLAATEKTEISDSIAEQLARARVQVFGVLSNVLTNPDAIPSEDAVRNEVAVLSKINSMPEVVKSAGGRKQDRAFQQAVKEVPEACLALRAKVHEAQKLIKAKKLQDCADKLLPKVLACLEEWKKITAKYHGDATRAEFLPHSAETLDTIDVILDYGLTCEKSATSMLGDMGFEIIKLASLNAKTFAEAMSKTAGGHNTEDYVEWYNAMPTRDLSSIPKLLTCFNDVLANAEMSETLDEDINRFSQDHCL